MKLVKILMLVITTFLINTTFASEPSPSDCVTPIQEIKSEEMSFETLPEEPIVGDLASIVKEEDTSLDDLANASRRKRENLFPYSEQVAYVEGSFGNSLCHIGHYPRCIVYTPLEGPYYGMQVIKDYAGQILQANYKFEREITSGGGVILHHRYSDSTIYTGTTQVMSFRK